LFREKFPEAQFTSIESPLTAAGIPDCEYCFPDGKSGWIEFKRTNSMRIGSLKPMQVAWLERRRRLGGRAFIAVRRVIEKRSCDELWVVDCVAAREVMAKGLLATLVWLEAPWHGAVYTWAGGPAKWNYHAVKWLLTKEPKI